MGRTFPSMVRANTSSAASSPAQFCTSDSPPQADTAVAASGQGFSPQDFSPQSFSPQGREAREATEVGNRIADRYQIQQLLREDELTCTVLARHLSLEEHVHVQVLRAEQRFDTRLSAQYLDAIKALARVKSS